MAVPTMAQSTCVHCSTTLRISKSTIPFSGKRLLSFALSLFRPTPPPLASVGKIVYNGNTVQFSLLCWWLGTDTVPLGAPTPGGCRTILFSQNTPLGVQVQYNRKKSYCKHFFASCLLHACFMLASCLLHATNDPSVK